MNGARIDLLLVGPMAKLAYHAKRVSRKLLRNLAIKNAKTSGYLWLSPCDDRARQLLKGQE